MGHDVFVSHSSKDKPTADAVCAILESQGIRCWIAPRDIIPGKEWGASIIDAIKGAKVMVLIFSANANGSPQINKEVERAVHFAVPVIPMRIEDIVPTQSLEYFLSSPHWLDAFSPPMENHLQQLAQAVKRLIGLSTGDTAAINNPARTVNPPPPQPNRVNPVLETTTPPQIPKTAPDSKPQTSSSPMAYAKWAVIPVILLALGLGWFFGMKKSPVQPLATPVATTPPAPAAPPQNNTVLANPAPVVASPVVVEKPPVAPVPVVLASAPAAPDLSAHASTLPSIAVTDFSYDQRTGLTHGLPDILSDDLVNAKMFDVYEREKLGAVMREQGFQASGAVDPQSAVALGKVAGVHYILTGQIIDYGHESHTFNGYGVTTRSTVWRLKAAIQVIDVQTSKVLFSRRDEAEETVSDDQGLRVTDTTMDTKLAEEVADKLIQALEADETLKASAMSARALVPVTITSTPNNADVEADGVFYGNAGSTVKLPAGLHLLTISLPGFEQWSKKVVVQDGLTINAALAKKVDARIDIQETH